MKKSKFLIATVLLLSNVVCFAQAGFDDDVTDVPAAPIDQWMYLAMFAIILYGYKTITKTVKK